MENNENSPRNEDIFGSHEERANQNTTTNEPIEDPTIQDNEDNNNSESETPNVNEVPITSDSNEFWKKVNDFFKNIVEKSITIKDLLLRKVQKQHRCPYCFSPLTPKKDFRIIEVQSNNGMQIRNNLVENNSEKVKPTIVGHCSNCRHDLPADYFKSSAKHIVVIGGPSSGKSTFITSLINLLLNHNSVINDLGIISSIENKEGEDRFKINFHERLKSRLTIEGTKDPFPLPILIRLIFTKNKNKKLYMSLFDMKGEDFRNLNELQEKFPGMFFSNAILFLTNPFSIKGIYNLIKDENSFGRLPNKSFENDDFEKIIKNIYDIFVSREIIKANKKIKIPIAFGISRGDELEEIANLGLSDDLEEEFWDINELKSEIEFNSEELEEFLNDIEGGILTKIKAYFNHFKIFAVSPMGSRVKIEKKTDDGTKDYEGIYEEAYNPKGVLNPILWLLSEIKYLK